MSDQSTEAADTQLHNQIVLPENSVEYYLFVIDPKLDARKRLAQLESIRQTALQLCQNLTKDYIWQRDEFNLEVRNEDGNVFRPTSVGLVTDNAVGLSYLSGVTDYGDAVEDEWLIVYMIRQVTILNSSVWARIADADGEFLLIEAANVLPRWISPEIDHNRVWIHKGQLYIIPVDQEAAPKDEQLSLSKAVNFVTMKSAELVHSPFVQEEAFYRLEKYPNHVTDSLHYSLVTIPRRLAFVIHNVPRAISAAVEAFYLRDPIALKPILATSSSLVFPPEDMVTVSVRFSKILFAQLRSQRFEPPPRWQEVMSRSEGAKDDAAHARLETGMKLTCGFEMLAAVAENSKSRVVRELAIVIDDLKEDGDEALPSDLEISAWPGSQRDDDESWLDINYEDFEHELNGRRRASADDQKDSGFGNTQTQTDLRKIVSRFEAFLNDDKAGLDGAELDDMDYDDDDDDDMDDGSDSEDREVGFDEAEFSKMMREMMGFRPESSEVPKAHSMSQSFTPARFTEEEEDAKEVQEIKALSSQMESELNEHGALKLDPKESQAIQGKSKGKAEDESAAEESDEEVDIDYNLAKNLLESFKSQGGMPGPTGNILGMMGIQLPRDEEEDEERNPASNAGNSKSRSF